jgi:hypothetical protein
MMPDPTIDAIREVRHRISVSVGHDAQKLVEHYRKLQQRHSERIISRCAEQLRDKAPGTSSISEIE